MENILLIFSSNNKTIEQIKLYFACKFSKLFFLNLDLNNDFSSQIKEKLYQFHLKENGELKSPKEIFKDLPFIRLFK